MPIVRGARSPTSVEAMFSLAPHHHTVQRRVERLMRRRLPSLQEALTIEKGQRELFSVHDFSLAAREKTELEDALFEMLIGRPSRKF